MSRGSRLAIAALVVLTLIGVIWPDDQESRTGTSFGTVPEGQRALFELLAELGFPVGRSYASPEDFADDAVVWWIEPRELCAGSLAPADAEELGEEEGEEAEEDAEERARAAAVADAEALWDLRPWLEAGGTGVVFLPVRPHLAMDARGPRVVRVPGCDSIAGLAVPARSEPPPEGADLDGLEDAELEVLEEAADAEASEPEASDAVAATEETAEGEPDPGLLERWLRGDFDLVDTTAVPQRLEGDLLPGPRVLLGPELRRFLDPGAFRVRATLDGLPFVLEQRLGAGRLVLVADATPMTNALLGRADASLLAVDLVRAFGTPLLDERAHGLRAEQRPLHYLAASPALPVFLGLLVLGGLTIWWGRAVPPRTLGGVDAPAPSVERFVASLAALYARSRDHARLGERYLELTLARLRRRLGISPEAPKTVIVEALRRQARVPGEELRLLTEPEPVKSVAGLRARARRLDALYRAAGGLAGGDHPREEASP